MGDFLKKLQFNLFFKFLAGNANQPAPPQAHQQQMSMQFVAKGKF